MLPNRLRIVNGAMALDGGSTVLDTVDESEVEFHFFLEWSIDAQQTGTSRWLVNDVEIPKGSPEEAAWLDLLRESATAPSGSVKVDSDRSPFRGTMLLSGLDAAYLEATAQGADEALRILVDRVIAIVTSSAYRSGQGAEIGTATEDAVRDLMAKGLKIEAMRIYRLGYPNADLAEAKHAVERIAAENAP